MYEHLPLQEAKHPRNIHSQCCKDFIFHLLFNLFLNESQIVKILNGYFHIFTVSFELRYLN
jgi:hypothetical protein